jgi:hypothetical protein
MGASRVGPQTIREYLARMRERYDRSGRDAKAGLLDEVCATQGQLGAILNARTALASWGSPAAARNPMRNEKADDLGDRPPFHSPEARQRNEHVLLTAANQNQRGPSAI